MDARTLVERVSKLLSDAEEANTAQIKRGVDSFDEYKYLLGVGQGMENARGALRIAIAKLMKEELSDDE